MTREQHIVQTLVELADTAGEDLDAVDLLHCLTERCVELLGCAEAGVLLADGSGRLLLMASSGDRPDALAQDRERRSTFAPAAGRPGPHSVQTVPLRAGGETIGVLDLFRSDAGAIPDRDVRLAQGMADVAAGALARRRTLREVHDVVGELQGVLDGRIAIEQAKGILAQRAQVSVDCAFARMRDHARRGDRRISEVAADIVDGRLTFAGLDAGASE